MVLNMFINLKKGITGGPVTKNFQLYQVEFHWGQSDKEGSEHLVDGVAYAGEVCQ